MRRGGGDEHATREEQQPRWTGGPGAVMSTHRYRRRRVPNDALCLICGGDATVMSPDPLCKCCYQICRVYYGHHSEEQMQRAMRLVELRAKRILFVLKGADAVTALGGKP